MEEPLKQQEPKTMYMTIIITINLLSLSIKVDM